MSVVTTSSSTSTTPRAAVDYLRSQAVTVLSDPTASNRPHRGQRWVYFLAPWGLQLELVYHPSGKGFDRQQTTAGLR
jgi:hypothetical protein